MTFIVGWAFEHGKYPQQVLDYFKEHPREKALLMAYAVYADDRAQREAEQQRKEQDKKLANTRRSC